MRAAILCGLKTLEKTGGRARGCRAQDAEFLFRRDEDR